MAFGMNRVELIGRLGADVTINNLTSGGRVANLSIATDESYLNRQTGEKVDRTEWHRIVTFQDGLIDMFQRHAKKGRLSAGMAKAASARNLRRVIDGRASDEYLDNTGRSTPSQPSALCTLPGRSVHRSRSPNWLNTNSGCRHLDWKCPFHAAPS